MIDKFNDPHSVLDDLIRTIPNKTRELPLPYDHLTVQGPTVADRHISRDIQCTLSYLVGMSPNGPVDVECTTGGTLKVATVGPQQVLVDSSSFSNLNSGQQAMGGSLVKPVNNIYGVRLSAQYQSAFNGAGSWNFGICDLTALKFLFLGTFAFLTTFDTVHYNYRLDETIMFPAPIDTSAYFTQKNLIQPFVTAPAQAGLYAYITTLYSS